MFGLATPCRHSLPGRLHQAWTAHLCGLCLTLRDRHGHPARLTTNVDAVLVSVLVAAQRPALGATRQAGACALRGLRAASVVRADAPAARLAAGVSLVLAGGVVGDHAADGDVPRPARPAASLLSRRWERRGAAELAGLGLGAGALTSVVPRQVAAEARATSLLAAVAPAEDAAAEAFAHTAAVAGRPGNAAVLAGMGRLVGRVAHLTDALVDLHDDTRRGRWNPLTATGTPPAAAVRVVEEALAGIRTAMGRLDLPGRRPGADDAAVLQADLAERLLTRVLPASVHRLLARSGHRTAPACTGHRCGDVGHTATAPDAVRAVGPRAGEEAPPWGSPGPQGPWGTPDGGLAGGLGGGLAADGEEPPPGTPGAAASARTRRSSWCDGWCDCCDCCNCCRACDGHGHGGSGGCCCDGCCCDGCDGCCCDCGCDC